MFLTQWFLRFWCSSDNASGLFSCTTFDPGLHLMTVRIVKNQYHTCLMILTMSGSSISNIILRKIKGAQHNRAKNNFTNEPKIWQYTRYHQWYHSINTKLRFFQFQEKKTFVCNKPCVGTYLRIENHKANVMFYGT